MAGTGKIGSSPMTSGPMPTTTAQGPRGRITLHSKLSLDAMSTSLTVDAVAAKVLAAYLAGMKRCYKHVLGKDTTAKGSLELELTVTETGRAKATVASFDKELTSCVDAIAKSWRFPVPKDADGEATTAMFKLSFKLVPE